jgi:diadenosine tetraphosphate (Ap4A) HIT family hydrolase
MSEFLLHERLAADTFFVADWALSRVLLMNDVRYGWLVLVPRRPGLSEYHDLSQDDARLLADETRRAGAGLKRVTGCVRTNVGLLGNLVPQTHVHVVARNPGDPAWPGPVWGHSPAMPYEAAARDALVAELVKTL